MISTSKILLYPDRITGNHKPITADIFLNNYCNNKCEYCTYERWGLKDKPRELDYNTFRSVIRRLQELGVEGFILSGGGEPTCSKDFDRITEWLEDEKITYGINTNFNILKYIAPKYLKVSLDGYDEESYKRIRGVDRYEKVRDNIRTYVRWKNANGIKTSVGIQAVALSVDDVRMFYRANCDLPVDYISIRPVESTKGIYYRDHENDAQEIIEAIKKIRETDSRVIVNFKWTMLRQEFSQCVAEWAQIAVNEKAEIMYCCHKPYEIVGSVFDPDILRKKAEYKTDMSMCDIPCRMTAPNMEIESMKKNSERCFL